MVPCIQNRKYRVVIGQATSGHYGLDTGVPQGYILGPVQFSLYVQPIAEYDVNFHYYIDDLQLMFACKDA